MKQIIAENCPLTKGGSCKNSRVKNINKWNIDTEQNQNDKIQREMNSSSSLEGEKL